MGQQCVSPGIDGLAFSAGDRDTEEVSAANQVPDTINDSAADDAVANDSTGDDQTEEDLALDDEADEDLLLDDEPADDDGQDGDINDGEDAAGDEEDGADDEEDGADDDQADDEADDDEAEPADEEGDDDELIVVAANTEQLDDPVDLTLAEGSDILAAGVGLLGGQPETISIEVPDGVTVEQVLLYWEGQAETADEQGDTDEIVLEGSIIVEGVRIGGPTRFGPLPDFWTSTYRADITELDLIGVGPNDLTVEGLDFSQRNNGVGILVVVDDGVNTTDPQIKDGNDLAFFEYNPPLDTTAPVTFNFPASTEDRTASLALFVSSVALEDPTSTFGRPTIIRIWVDDVFVEDLVDELENSDGPEWDTVVRLVDIPAGATSLTVQSLSEDAGTGQFAGKLPASLTWSAAAFALLPAVPPLPPEPPTPPVPEGEGCTPGFWQQEQHFGHWTPPYDPDDLFSDHFEDAFPDMTLVEVLAQGGGGLIALGRHTVAALLNAASPDVDYGWSPQEVIDEFNAVYPGTDDDYESLKDFFEDLNERYCPLDDDEEDDDDDEDDDDEDDDEDEDDEEEDDEEEEEDNDDD